MNEVLARLLFSPCLHNFTLWKFEHNRAHHQHTNVRGENSYSPMSWHEYSKASKFRQSLERFYRNPVGFGTYYLVERWWKKKFFPLQRKTSNHRAKRDFVLLLVWSILVCSTLVALDAIAGANNGWMAIFWGYVLPFLVWNQLMGTTAFLQHTNPRAPWFAARQVRTKAMDDVTGLEVTVNVKFPRWYDFISHNIMHHAAHHVNPRIPWFRLRQAQLLLATVAGPRVITESMGPRYTFDVARRCQLYDYESNTWLNFNGQPTTYTEEPCSNSWAPLTVGNSRE
jgi:omega-6 fatty acid desaturase (delta-12 desaturase)